MAAQFQHLFSPLKIGSMTVRNRIVSPAHGSGFAGPDGMGDRQFQYYVTRAKGGLGLIVTQFQSVRGQSSASPPAPLESDAIIAPFKRLADAVHQEGVKIVCQLAHMGRQSSSRLNGGYIWGPSPLAATRSLPHLPPSYEIPHEVDHDDIQDFVRAFANGARRMRAAGLDGVEIHGAHGYLIWQFLSPHSNKRTDEYGGSLENRMRLALEIIDAIRAEVGRDFVVGFRTLGDEFVEGGLTLEDVKVIAQRIAATGKIDYISISQGKYDSMPMIVGPMYVPPGSWVYLAAGIKEAVDIPVFTVGRINDPIQAEKILAEGQADMIVMNRPLIADPELPNKAREGRLDEIRKCIACNEGCWGRLFQGMPITCAQNPEAGRELEMAIVPAATRKRVVVVGGGAAGMETARVAALRGHSVALYEKGSELGGQVLIAAKAPMRHEFAEVARFYSYQLKKLGVEVNLNAEVTAETILEMAPDAVVIATGSVPSKPLIPGIDQSNVVEVRAVLEGKAETGQNVVVVAGEHHIQGLVTADYLAERGKRVEILNEFYFAGSQVEINTQELLYRRLLEKGVRMTPLTGVREIAGTTVVAFNVLTREERRIEGVDTVVLAYPGQAQDELWRSLKGRVGELHGAGQCMSPRRLLDSILDGARVGRAL